MTPLTVGFTGSDSERIGGAIFGPANRTRFTLMIAYPAGHQGITRDAGLLREVNREELIQRFRDIELDCTVVNTVGLYDGSQECSARCECITELADDPDAGNRLLHLAEDLAVEWEQDEVWLTSEPITLMRVASS